MDSDLELSFESDNEELTAGDILKSMEEIWLNEKFAPEILQNKMEIVECLYLQIQEMEKNVERLEKNDIRRCAHELELIRIRFLLSSYLRIRLLKIETFAQTILAEEEVRRNDRDELYLTEAETTFANTFKNLMVKYIDESFKFMPGYVADESKEHPIKPNLHSFVFFQSNKVVNGVVVDDGGNNDDVVDINAGSKMIMTYNSITTLLKNGDVRLI